MQLRRRDNRMSRLPTLSAFTLNDGNLPLKEKASAVVFSEYLAAVKFAVAQVKSQVRYRGLNRGGGWLRDPLEVPQNLQRASLRSTRINGVRH